MQPILELFDHFYKIYKSKKNNFFKKIFRNFILNIGKKFENLQKIWKNGEKMSKNMKNRQNRHQKIKIGNIGTKSVK